jgi:recombination protein RecA
VKNKLAPPFREAEFDILYGAGISREGDLLDLAVQHNIVEKSGSWYSYAGERIGQGRENARQFLKENADICTKLDREVRKQLGMIRETTNGTPELVETAPPAKTTTSVPAGRAPR